MAGGLASAVFYCRWVARVKLFLSTVRTYEIGTLFGGTSLTLQNLLRFYLGIFHEKTFHNDEKSNDDD